MTTKHLFRAVCAAAFLFVTFGLSAIDFPLSIGPFHKLGVVTYKQQGLGTMYRYGVNAANNPFGIDFYVYNLGEKKIEDGIGGANVKKAFDAAIDEIQLMSKRGNYSDLKQLKNGTVEIKCMVGKTLKFYHAAFSFRSKDGKEMLSDLLLAGYENQFLKLRFTTPSSVPEKIHARALELILDGMSKGVLYPNLKTTVDEETRDTVFRSVKMLENDPTGSGAMAIPALMKFVEDSPDVLVVYQEAAIGWMAGVPKEDQTLFMAAFSGGNIRAQLEKNICQDHPWEGLQCVLKTYTAWKKAKGKSIDILDKMLEMDKNGGLKTMLDKNLQTSGVFPAKK